jgi:preprotein translocase subunit SecG
MEILKIILIIIYFIVALALIILTLIQTKDDAGLSSTITGSSTNNFYEKNKGRTKEGKQKRWTIILGVVFAVLTIALGIVYMA